MAKVEPNLYCPQSQGALHMVVGLVKGFLCPVDYTTEDSVSLSTLRICPIRNISICLFGTSHFLQKCRTALEVALHLYLFVATNS